MITPRWSIYGYAGRMDGGGVVQRLFAENRLTFAYLESSVQF